MITDKMLEENTTPWGLLSEEMKEAFTECGVENLEWYEGAGEWKRGAYLPSPDVLTLRKKPVPLTKPDIPWGAIKDEFKWAARDRSGAIWLYEQEPKPRSVVGEWGGSGRTTLLGSAVRMDPGTCDWKDSLVERPK